MSTKEVIRLTPYNEPPSAPGTTILSVWKSDAVEATHIFPDSPRLVWPFPGATIGERGPEDAALAYLFGRDYVGDKIYVVGDPNA